MKKKIKNGKDYTEKELEFINTLMSHGKDRIQAEWYVNSMQIWTKDDYENYEKLHKWMFDEPTGDERFDRAKTIKQLNKNLDKK